MQKKNTDPDYTFPSGLAQPAIRALHAAGYTNLTQLTKVSEADLLKLHGMGQKGMEILRKAMHAKGFSFANPAHAGRLLSEKEQVIDSPDESVQNHIRNYVTSNGENGHIWHGLPTLLLITRGRKSGKLHRTPLIYGRDENNYLLVASNDGSSKHPLWYLNLVKSPEVEIQAGAQKFLAHARTATPAEKPALWKIMTAIFPRYDTYQAKTTQSGRDIPLVIVEPVE